MKKGKILRGITFFIGLALCSYSLISSIIEGHYQKNAISTYKNKIETVNESNVEECIKNAKQYNSMLYKSSGVIIDQLQDGVLSTESYNGQLNLIGNGIMGSLQIPKINVDLPIYHGTSEEVLSIGAGHLQDSSLPVGGENTRCILTGHRGLPSSKLFTRLDEIEEGDFFFIQVCNMTLAYQVCEIAVIRPEEIDSLDIKAERDLVSLVTCTPYGINSHRLVVTGERIDYQEKADSDHMIEKWSFSWRELLFTSLPFIFIAVAIIQLIKDRKGKTHAKK